MDKHHKATAQAYREREQIVSDGVNEFAEHFQGGGIVSYFLALKLQCNHKHMHTGNSLRCGSKLIVNPREVVTELSHGLEGNHHANAVTNVHSATANKTEAVTRVVAGAGGVVTLQLGEGILKAGWLVIAS